MFFKNFSKCVLAGTIVESIACSWVCANKESEEIKAEVNSGIENIIRRIEGKKIEECLRFFGDVKDGVSKLQNKNVLKIVSDVFKKVQFVEEFEKKLFRLKDLAAKRFLIFLNKAETLDKKIRDEISENTKEVEKQGNDLIAALKIYYQSLNSSDFTDYLSFTGNDDKGITRFFPEFLRTDNVFAEFSKLYNLNDKDILEELDKEGKSSDTEPIFFESKEFDNIIEAIAVNNESRDIEGFIQKENVKQADTKKITGKEDTKKGGTVFKVRTTDLNLKKNTKEKIKEKELKEIKNIILELRKRLSEYEKLHFVESPKDEKFKAYLPLYSEKANLEESEIVHNKKENFRFNTEPKNKKFFEDIFDDKKYRFVSKEEKEEIDKYIENNSLKEDYVKIIDGAYARILRFAGAEVKRVLLKSFLGRWLVSNYVVFKMNIEVDDFELFKNVFKDAISLKNYESFLEKDKSQDNIPITRALINRCLDIAIECESLSEESFLAFSKMKKYCNISGVLKGEFLENLFSEISGLDFKKKDALDKFFYILSTTGEVVTEEWKKILEENSNFEVNSISQSIEELFKLRDKIDPSVNKVLKNFYKSLILKNYAADLSRAYLRRRRFFFKNDSEVIQDEDLKESYRTTKSKDQMKANFNIKYRSSKLENLKSEHKKDSRENSPRHMGQEFSSLKSIFKMTHTKQDKILHSKITFITSVLKSDE